ncbi:3-deoxy-7-phosphoheptulonate synthase [Lachnospira pectinoschiza]|uniref:Phospho-2-dehydro-3-deoxyheptonate aldolase n=1 Tax=Lachnospira pectinoschiza TaxID=28052 RepID=A0A1G9VPJ5_9FIRM|nr:3-deoxy-7-phosphoheptulonate synthase [Lachnospira pectinoschiza]SDM73993.1 3-deoxy-D-arabinoheptulosonate-7-phosphate synthase [Lachnospira pectinoschiza]
MSFEFVKQLPTPKEIKEAYPLSKECIELKKKRDQEIADIFTGKSDKFIAIIGPCSADNEDAVLDYTTRLAKVQEKVADKILIIPRVYTNKPRTTGIGYKGMLHQPDPEKKSDLYAGLVAIRKMHIDIIKETGLTPADEMLYPDNFWYLEDVLSYVAVGARSVENQEHRLVSSGIDVPVGMKNPTSGDFSVMLNSVVAAQSKQTFIYRRHEVNTQGNPLTHCILRGAVNKHGQNNPNYHYEDVIRLFNMYKARDLENPALIIDTNHSNSGKQYMEQIRIVKEILHNCRYNKDIRTLCKGVMVESYIEPGNQKVGEGVYGKSITDACLGWKDSENLIYEIADRL